MTEHDETKVSAIKTATTYRITLFGIHVTIFFYILLFCSNVQYSLLCCRYKFKIYHYEEYEMKLSVLRLNRIKKSIIK